ncbi:hypothetical protein OF83DRAFT_1171506 [Amylostereum chailletii]|nr:hypothetical protein OF83DRAFT_1171506 [Amylostereum chailletii]
MSDIGSALLELTIGCVGFTCLICCPESWKCCRPKKRQVSTHEDRDPGVVDTQPVESHQMNTVGLKDELGVGQRQDPTHA